MLSVTYAVNGSGHEIHIVYTYYEIWKFVIFSQLLWIASSGHWMRNKVTHSQTNLHNEYAVLIFVPACWLHSIVLLFAVV